MAGADGDIVEQAEAHRLVAGRVVPAGPHGAERSLVRAADHRITSVQRCARTPLA